MSARPRRPIVPAAGRAALLACATILAPLAAARPAAAQSGLASAVATVSLTATKTSGVSVSITSGAAQSLASVADGAVNTFATPVGITTTWDLHPSTGSLSLVAYFSTPAQALANGTSYIASSLVKGRVTTGTPTTFTAFTQNGLGAAGTTGGSLRLFTLNINGANRRSSRTDNLELQLDLTGQPALAAGTYSGTLNIRAVTQ